MIKLIPTLALGLSLFAFACQNNTKINNANTNSAANKTTEVSFTVAKNYFVNNTVTKLDNPKIETEEQFSQVFGMARTMGEDGKPTAIDFSKQYVIAVVLPETDLSTNIEAISLQKSANNEITLNYKVVRGQKQSYTMRPSLLLIVDKKDNGAVKLNENK